MPRKLLLIHGYSANALDFGKLCTALSQKGVASTDINVGNYVSLNNEITIKDIAEGLDRALRNQTGFNQDEEFDAIVHSTGMLVLRSWLTNYGTTVEKNTRLKRLKHLIGVAPATWGSPQAHKGRTWLGALVKGSKNPGPDFLDAGDQVLDGLELGSRFTWDLAHADLLADPPYYGTGTNTPYACVFIGNTPYEDLASVANDPGTDGTVRWSGCTLNTRKISVDLTRLPDETDTPSAKRVEMSKWADQRLDVPMIPVEHRNHGTLISDPESGMVDRIVSFLKVDTADSYKSWLDEARTWSEPAKQAMLVDPGKAAAGVAADVKKFFGHLIHSDARPIEGWQQFVMHARDERGDPVTDYLVQVLHPERDDKGNMLTDKDGQYNWVQFENMYTDVHAYRTDQSFRCIHIRLPTGISSGTEPLRMRIGASTGTKLMLYQGYNLGVPMTMDESGGSVDLDITKAGIFFPFTTTLVEIILNREPAPLKGVSQIFGLQKPGALSATNPTSPTTNPPIPVDPQ